MGRFIVKGLHVLDVYDAPSEAMNAMERGMRVFFIQKESAPLRGRRRACPCLPRGRSSPCVPWPARRSSAISTLSSTFPRRKRRWSRCAARMVPSRLSFPGRSRRSSEFRIRARVGLGTTTAGEEQRQEEGDLPEFHRRTNSIRLFWRPLLLWPVISISPDLAGVGDVGPAVGLGVDALISTIRICPPARAPG